MEQHRAYNFVEDLPFTGDEILKLSQSKHREG